MSTKPNDFSAFPILERGGGGLELTCTGMSMRDYFAAKAMQAAITGAHGVGSLPDDERRAAWSAVAGLSYEIADAMLAARSKT